MVIRCLVVDLEQVVINIADGQFGPHPVQVQGFKSQIGHDRIDVVGQGLIHRHFDFLARHQFRRFCQMGRKQFLRQIHCHGKHTPLIPSVNFHSFSNISYYSHFFLVYTVSCTLPFV